MSFTRTIRLNPNVIQKKEKKLACNRLQTYSTLDGYAIAVDERSYFGRALRSVAMQRELHYRIAAQHLSPPRDSFDARNCAAAHETERSATILLHGTKTG